MKAAVALFAGLLFVASPAQAEDWWFVGYVGKPEERVVYFADAGVNVVDGYKHLWTERVLERNAGRGEALVRSLFIFDCDKRRFAEMQQLLFDREGVQIPSPRFLPEWSFIPPSSMGANLMRFACQDERVSGAQIRLQDRHSAALERVFQR